MSVEDEPSGPAPAPVLATPRRRLFVGAALVALALGLAVVCVALTVARQRQRDEATNAAITLCRQVGDLGQPCRVDPSALPWSGEVGHGQALVPAAPPAMRPLPPVYVQTTPTGPAGADETVTADPMAPGSDAAIVTIELTEGRLVLTYTDGSRVDAGPVAGDLTSIVRLPSPASTPRGPTPTPSDTVDPGGTDIPVPLPIPSGGPS